MCIQVIYSTCERHLSRSNLVASSPTAESVRNWETTDADRARCRERSMLSGRPKTYGLSVSGICTHIHGIYRCKIVDIQC